ncbi:hypothetical protein [Microbulbifer sp. YPW16]|uniref:hypothetical protein n=1 Tax=Microbulbifer sp. YPW16 TaxID=2904242 RepID=UPI001E417416|nr:hypothetical protein [Microbulbifer sp. YPW16]UHQ55794.1 hypothetical protein LVE68_02050 [Microbulbifer sp. YPW16]
MSDSDSRQDLQRNSLYSLAAVGAVLLGALLTLGAYGHFAAVWGQMISEDTALPRRLLLMLPGVTLAGAAVLNILLSKPLWQARGYALTATLVGNLVATAYLVYLLVRGVPGHPIGIFLALEMSLVILLVSIRAGLVWPALADANIEKS